MLRKPHITQMAGSHPRSCWSSLMRSLPKGRDRVSVVVLVCNIERGQPRGIPRADWGG